MRLRISSSEKMTARVLRLPATGFSREVSRPSAQRGHDIVEEGEKIKNNRLLQSIIENITLASSRVVPRRIQDHINHGIPVGEDF